jgi:1-aminocyclopropane-1-carboxylate deaminase
VLDLDRGCDIEPRIPSPLTELTDDRLAEHDVRVYLKRDDLIHPEIPGNKWRKLKYNLAAAWERGATTLLTFGGAYSNHLRATAAAGYYFGFRTIGIVRGERHDPLNESLAFAADRGMELSYLDRAGYRNKNSPEMLSRLQHEFGDFYLIPEGGSNALALYGCRELPGEIDVPFDVICCPSGTGATVAGISWGLAAGQRAIGFSVLKGGRFLEDDVTALQRSAGGAPLRNWSIDCEHHFGGFARRTPELDDFIESFETRHGIRLDWVYVAKMMFGVFELVQRGAFAPGSTLVATVTG